MGFPRPLQPCACPLFRQAGGRAPRVTVTASWFIRRILTRHVVSIGEGGLPAIGRRLIDECVEVRQSRDNVTAMLVVFEGAWEPSAYPHVSARHVEVRVFFSPSRYERDVVIACFSLVSFFVVRSLRALSRLVFLFIYITISSLQEIYMIQYIVYILCTCASSSSSRRASRSIDRSIPLSHCLFVRRASAGPPRT